MSGFLRLLAALLLVSPDVVGSERAVVVFQDGRELEVASLRLESDTAHVVGLDGVSTEYLKTDIDTLKTLRATAELRGVLRQREQAISERQRALGAGGAASEIQVLAQPETTAQVKPALSQRDRPGKLVAPDLSGAICPLRLELVRDGDTQRVAYCSNVDLMSSEQIRGVSRLVVIVHGSGRKAPLAYKRMARLSESLGLSSRTAVLAPQFIGSDEVERHGLDAGHAYWTGGWSAGGLSASKENHPRPFRISSFWALDRMIAAVLERIDVSRLDEVVIVGHSAGGQFVNRYAAVNRMGYPTGTAVRYVVANPSSYLYWSAKRPTRRGIFAEPSRSQRDECPGYNRYRYGLKNLYAYLRRVGAEDLRRQYARRHVTYLLGAKDTNAQQKSLDKSCGARLQGAHRLERGEQYLRHLKEEFGMDILRRHKSVVVSGVGHSSRVLESKCGIQAVFGGDRGCSELR